MCFSQWRQHLLTRSITRVCKTNGAERVSRHLYCACITKTNVKNVSYRVERVSSRCSHLQWRVPGLSFSKWRRTVVLSGDIYGVSMDHFVDDGLVLHINVSELNRMHRTYRGTQNKIKGGLTFEVFRILFLNTTKDTSRTKSWIMSS